MPKKQLKIAGTEQERIKEVEDAAEGYVDARDKRMRLTKKEVEAHAALLAVMKEHKLTVYRDESVTPPLLVTLIPGKDKVKVAQTEVEDGDEETDEGEEATA